MKKVLFSAFILFASFSFLNAQQVHQFSQYTANHFAFNPAVAGTQTNELVTKATYRRQWWGSFEGNEPTTLAVSMHGNFSKKKAIGLGAMIFNDQLGPQSTTGIQLAYAYHIPIKKDEQYLSFGLAGTFMNRTIDYNKLNAYDKDDNAIIASTNESQFKGDAHFGAYYYGPNFWLGVSSLQLIQSKFKLSNNATVENLVTVENARHFYGTAGYRFFINDDFALQPSVLLKYVQAVPVSTELTLMAYYQNNYWLGLNYRTDDAVSLMLGIDLDNGLNIGYAFDFITSELNNYSSGSHELVLGYDILWREGETRRKAKMFDYSRRRRL